MRQINLSSRALHAFLTLATCRNFTVAAERCHMSQSAFSQLVGRLEEEIGSRLFDRTSRAVSLTIEGEIFLPVATNMIGEIDSVVNDIHAHAQGREGKITIAALPSLCSSWLPEVLAAFRSAKPQIQVRLYDVPLERIQAMVREGRADIGVNADAGSKEEFQSHLIHEDSFYLVCPPEHPLARLNRVSLQQLAGYEYIHTMRSASMWQRIYPYLADVGVKDTGLDISTFSTLAGLVANGMGISVVVGSAISIFTTLGIMAIPVESDKLTYEVRMIAQKSRILSPAARTLLDMMKQHPLVHQPPAGYPHDR